MSRTATDEALIIDRRRMRADVLSHQILHALEPWIDRLQRLEEWADKHREEGERHSVPHSHRDVHRVLFDLFYATGAEVITDADRVEAGLEFRDCHGLTPTELRIMEDRRMEAMLRPMPYLVPVK